MVFNSLTFLGFILVIFSVYWFVPHRYRLVVLLLANVWFYLSFDIKYLVVLVLNILVSYCAALLIRKKNSSKTIYVLSLILCLSSLIILKYANFTVGVLNDLGFSFFKRIDNIILPVGVSFFTFEIVSYLTDVYKGTIEPESNLGYYACYISFFPTISSGPIERAGTFIPQLKKEKIFEYTKAADSLKVIAWGLFKKIVIADNLAVYVNNIYGNLKEYSGFVLVLVIFLYSIEIYCDFSGYSNMARGVAGLLGYEVNVNFRIPYFSTTVKEFWSKWHISLTSWLRDYIYIPLGGNRKGTLRKYHNIMVVFFVSGLWHGADYTFIVWGLIHAVLEIFEGILKIKQYTIRNVVYYLRVLLIFILVSLTWVFFRADTLADALYIFANMFKGITDIRAYIVTGLYSLDMHIGLMITKMLIYLIPLVIVEYFAKDRDVIERISRKNAFIRYALYILLVIAVLFLHNIGEANFIYFKF